MKEIQITFGFNDSDNTVGWKRYENAMTMYYLPPTQKFIQEEHSFPLVPGLERVQIISVYVLPGPSRRTVTDERT